jgi:hypothetical protein
MRLWVEHTYSTLQVYQRSYSQVVHIPPKMEFKMWKKNICSCNLVFPIISTDLKLGDTENSIHVKYFVIDAYL